MIDRTEELGLAARLTIVVGGQPLALRTLNLEESEAWQAKLSARVAAFDLPDQGNPAAMFAAFARQPTSVMLDLVQSYDIDGHLPADLRRRFTQVELYAAVKQMVTAELPFVTDLRSVAEAFGPQLRLALSGVVYQALGQLQQASSTNLPLPTGDSTPQLSDNGSPRNGSSSSGPTDSAESSEKPKRPLSKPKSPPPTAMQTSL